MLSHAPFFILANPRSGSSLLRIICDSHPNITVPPECGFMEWWYSKYSDWKETDNSKRLDEFLLDFFQSKKIETWHLNKTKLREYIITENPKNYGEIVSTIYMFYSETKTRNRAIIWGDKNNYYIHKLSIINKLYPNAKYIHLVRDGRDVACSYKNLKEIQTSSKYFPKLSTNIEMIAEEWNQNNNKILNFKEALEDKNFLTLRFEDIVNDLRGNCIKISRFLGLDFSQEMLSYDLRNKNEKIEPKETLDWKRKTLEKPDPETVGKYLKELTKEELEYFNQYSSLLLKKFGYA